MATPPALTELADAYPLPSNATFKGGITKLLNYALGLLGSTGNAAEARTALGIGSAITFRNLLINANGAINQRSYVTATATSGTNQYTLDRWRVVTSGQSVTFGAASPDRTMTAPAGGLEQVIEGASVIGGIYTLSWTGTATATVNGAAITNGGNTASLPANTNVTVRFIGGTVTLPQFELGTVATPFERRLPGLELQLCQRYFQTSYDGQAPGTASASTNRRVALSTSASTPGVQFHVGLLVPMRASPTITIYNPSTGATGSMRNESAGSDLVATTFGTPGSGFFAAWNSAANTAALNIYSIHYTASAEL